VGTDGQKQSESGVMLGRGNERVGRKALYLLYRSHERIAVLPRHEIQRRPPAVVPNEEDDETESTRRRHGPCSRGPTRTELW